jgi:5-formyltetrahydrofolate cyclo-ligase
MQAPSEQTPSKQAPSKRAPSKRAPSKQAPSKQALRRSLLAARRSLDLADVHAAGERLAEQLIRLPVYPTAGGVVAAYVSRKDEPPTEALLARLAFDDITVLLPALRPDFDLGWGAYPPDRLRSDLQVSSLGVAEPTTDIGEPASVLDADLIVCPGLAADRRGYRLGRGGGSYDRVLARYKKPQWTCLLLYDDEVLDEIPIDRHDQRVGWLVTPKQVIQASG